MRGRAVLGLFGVVVAGGASAAVLWSGAVGVPHALLSQLPFGIGGGGTPASVAARGGSEQPAPQAPSHSHAGAARTPSPFLPPFVPAVGSAGTPGTAVEVPVEPGAGSVQRSPKPSEPPPPEPKPTPPPIVTPPPPQPAPTPTPAPPSQPPAPPSGSNGSGGSSGSGSSGGSSGPPPPPPPPPKESCTIGAGALTISNSTAQASALVQGCSATDLRLTLAAYRHSTSSFVLLASATLYPVSDGTTSQALQLPSCSTDVVLIRGLAPATVSSFSSLLARTTAPGCGGTSPTPGAGDPAAPPQGTDGSNGSDSADSSGDGSSDAPEPGGDSGGDHSTGDPQPPPPPPSSGDAGSSQQTDPGSSGTTGTNDGTSGGGGDNSIPAGTAATGPHR